MATPKPKRVTKAKKQVTIVLSDLESDDEVVVAERLTPRPKRNTKPPKRFNQSEMY